MPDIPDRRRPTSYGLRVYSTAFDQWYAAVDTAGPVAADLGPFSSPLRAFTNGAVALVSAIARSYTTHSARALYDSGSTEAPTGR